MNSKNKFLVLFAGLLLACNAQAVSTSAITPTLTITLTDILLGGSTATDMSDYEAIDLVYSDSFFSESFVLGGVGSTSGSSSTSLNGSTINPSLGAGPLTIGDSLALSLNAQATANTGFVSRSQTEYVDFGFYNYTDDGSGNADTLTFLFDYTLDYSTMLTNGIAGDQALVEFNTIVELFDGSNYHTLDLFPQGMPGEIFELSNALGTATPGGMLSGSFSFDLSESEGYFTIESVAYTPTYINPVPVPAAVWLFGSGLLGLVGIARRKQ